MATSRQAAPVRIASVTEIVAPRINDAPPSADTNMIDALGLTDDERVALEIAVDDRSCRFLARAEDDALLTHLERQLGVAYPLAGLRRIDPATDPARARPGEMIRMVVLTLAAPAYLPLRTVGFAGTAPVSQADPLRGLVGATADLPPGWRALLQIVIAPAPRRWADGIARRLEAESRADTRPSGRRHGGTYGEGASSPNLVIFIVVAVMALAAWSEVQRMWDDGERLQLVAGGALLLLVAVAGIALAIGIARRRAQPVGDPALIRQKIGRTAYAVEVRLVVFAPVGSPSDAVDTRLGQIARAYAQFNRPDGNQLVSCRFDAGLVAREEGVQSLAPLARRARRAILTAAEIAGLWHLPRVAVEIPLLEQTGARQRAPRPEVVARGCLIGHHEHQGRRLPIHISDEALDHHAILVAATRAGKSSLMLVLARYLMERRHPGTLVLIDPQRQLARAALGLVPPERRGDVVAIDFGDTARPIGLNFLDTGLGWTRDAATERVLALFRRQWSASFGPRMEDLFAFGLATLYAANEALCRSPDGRARPEGRGEQYTILDLVPLYTYPVFRNALLATLRDPDVVAWWEDYATPLRQQDLLTWVNPVLNKVNAFGRSTVARALVGQPRATIDPRDWLDRDRIVIVSGAQGESGAEITALAGAAIFNILTETLAERETRESGDCPPVTIIADEFQSLPGADFERVLAQQGKFGARLVLATQTLAGLERYGSAERPRNLRAAIFANAYSHFIYHCSAEDARFLLHELGGAGVVDVEDLVGLAKYHCYCRLPHGGVRPPAFLVRLSPPPPSDPAWAATLARESALAWGRPRAQIEEDRDRARARVALMRTGGVPDGAAAGIGQAEVAPSGGGVGPGDPGTQSLPAPAAGYRARAKRTNVFSRRAPATPPVAPTTDADHLEQTPDAVDSASRDAERREEGV